MPFNIIMPGKDAGELFTKHPVMQKVTFTGSTNVGKKLIAALNQLKMSQWN